MRAWPASDAWPIGSKCRVGEAVLPLDGGEVGDGVLMLAAPRDERGLRDVEFLRNPGEGPPLNAEGSGCRALHQQATTRQDEHPATWRTWQFF